MSKKILKQFDEEIVHDGNVIPFKIIISRRKTLTIVVYPDQSVQVRAPNHTSIRYIKKLVEKRADWIKVKQLKFSKSIKPPVIKKFEDGEVYNYLGKEYMLKTSLDLINRVDIDGGNLVVSVTSMSKDRIKKLINEWYKESAKKIFNERMEIYRNEVLDIGIKYNGTPVLRQMRSMWGNCSRKGEIKLSYELVKKPLHCIDYVIVHELCHIKEFNHSKAFYALLDKIMPDWKIRRNELKGSMY